MGKFNYFKDTITKEEVQLFNDIPESDLANILKFINKSAKRYIRWGDVSKKFEKLGFLYIDAGTSGIVYKYKNYAIKIFTKDTGDGWYSESDCEILSKLQDISLYPKLYANCEGKFIIVEFIEGCNLCCFDEDEKMDIDYAEHMLDGFVKTIKKGLKPHDLHDNNTMIDKEGNFIIIDVGCFQSINTELMKDEDCIEMAKNILEKFFDEYFYFVQEHIEKIKKNSKDTKVA